MFGIFKKATLVAEKPVQRQEKVDLKKVTTKDIQEDIHKSFDSILKEFDLRESKETTIENHKNNLEIFKEENKSIYSKIDKLKFLNLGNTPTAKNSLNKLKEKEEKVKDKITKLEREIREAERTQELVREYNMKYPGYKFVDDVTIVKIMEKYNLYLGEAFTYAKEIPDKSLAIIGMFSTEIKQSEKVYQLIIDGSSRWNRYSIRLKPKVQLKPIPMSDTDSRGYSTTSFSHNTSHVDQEFVLSDFKIIAPMSHFEIPMKTHTDAYGDTIVTPLAIFNAQSRKMELSTRELNKAEEKRQEILDPIAVLEVKGGYIIMDAWDKEADIPEIKNPILN